MKFSHLSPALVALALAAPANAGDIENGEKEFGKCKSCHMVVADDGAEIVKGGRTGPNLYGVIGRAAGGADFRYSPSMKAAGEKGLVWDEANFAEYTVDPGKFLQAYLDDPKAKSTMSFKLRKGGEDIAAWLASLVE